MTVYVVIDTDEITDNMVIESVGNGVSFCESLNGLQSIMEFLTKFPNTMQGYKKYTYAEIVQYLIDNAVTWKLEI